MLAEAELLARSRAENFTVASRLLPPAARAHLLAFYAFARLVDEVGDSYEGDRRAALGDLKELTERALAQPETPCGLPVVAKAVSSVLAVGADPVHLLDLIAANEQDLSVAAYQTFEDLLGYCRLSANPVGRLVLAAFGMQSRQQAEWSDCICTGLQLAEHWQDVAEDAARGRVYLPREDLDRFGVDPTVLTRPGPAGRQLRALMVFEVARTRRLLDRGTPLIAAAPGRLRWAIAGYWSGGHAALDAVANRDFDVLAGSPRRSKLRTTTRALAAFTGRYPTREAA